MITGLLYNNTTNIEQIKSDFTEVVKAAYTKAKNDGVLRYNDVRPLIANIVGIMDFDKFFMDGDIKNIELDSEEYPETGILNFS